MFLAGQYKLVQTLQSDLFLLFQYGKGLATVPLSRHIMGRKADTLKQKLVAVGDGLIPTEFYGMLFLFLKLCCWIFIFIFGDFS